MNIPDILAFFGKAEALLQALIAGGVLKSTSGTDIATILADVTAVIAGTQQPSAALATEVAKLLSDLGTDGVIQGTLVNELAAAATKFASFVSDIQSGQAGLLGTGTLMGVHGTYQFIPDGSSVAKSEGM